MAASATTTLAGSPYDGTDGVRDGGSGPIGLDTPSGSNDNSYTQGAKENDRCPSVSTGSIPPSKADLSGIYAATATGTDGHNYLYLGWTRTDTNGTVTLDFELNQSGEILAPPTCNGVNPTRTIGDKLITYNFQGGQVDSIEIRTWNGTVWSAPINVAASGAAEGSISTDMRFGELVIDLEDAGIFTPGVCVNFASILLKSRASSSSFTNEMKDFIAPIPRSVSNCGSLTVRKTVVGGNVGDSFSFTVDCGETVDLNGADLGYTKTFSLTSGGARTLLDIRNGSSCTVTETVPGLSGNWTTSYTVDALSAVHNGRIATVSIDLGNRLVTFTNTRVTGSLTIQKITSGGTGTFSFDIACTGDAFDRTNVSAGPGAPYVLSGIPTGTVCTVTEDANGDFTQTLVVPSDGTVTITAGGQTVTFTNARNVGSLTITKVADAPGSFTFDVDCTVDAFDRDDVPVVPGTPYVLSGIPTGTSCVVTEDANGDFNQTSVIPADGTVVIGGSGSQTVAFVNTRKVGSLTITKTANAPGTFTFDVDCSVNSFDRLGVNPVVIVNGGTEVISNIPTGTTCTVTERDNPLFSSIVIPDGGTVEITTQGKTVAFTNTRNTGPLTITKTAVGGTGTFTFDVDCSDNTFDQVVTIDGSGSRTITGIPTTTSCTVTERSNPLFTTSVLPANGTVSIDAGGENVAFVNTAKPNGITIDKKVNGGDHPTVGDALVVHAADDLSYTVVITNNGQVPLTITAMSDSLYPGLIAACPQALGSVLAAGASFTCRYGVGAIADAHNVATVSAVDGLGRTLTDSDGTYVDVINPAITIVKTSNPVAISVSGSVTYIYVVTNVGDTTLRDILVTDDILGAIGRIPELAPGESVTLAKTVDVDASTPPTNIGTVVGTDVLGQTVTASDDATITVVLGEVLVLPAELPRTGSPLQAQTRAALVLIQVGLVLTLAGRRRWMVRRAG